jgi:small GTP-binding protein
VKEPLETVRTIDIRGEGGWSASWVSWSRSGRMVAVGAADVPAIRFIDVATGQTVRELKTAEGVLYAAWSVDDRFLAVMTGSEITVSNWPRLDDPLSVTSYGSILAWHPSEPVLAVSGVDGVDIVRAAPSELAPPAVRSWDARDAAWLPDGLVVGTYSGFLVSRNTGSSGQAHPGIHVAAAQGESWALGGRSLRVVTPLYGAVELVSASRGEHIAALSFSHDARLLASRSVNGDTAIWDLTTRQLLHTYTNDSPSNTFRSIAFSPTDYLLATPVAYGSKLAILRVNPDAKGTQTAFYTTAKIALVGDSGVGKTGLGWRLAHGEFKHHESTHGEQFWVVDNISTVRDDGAQCEAVLFDLAGQPDYRLIHSLFLDDADVALIVFDATNRQDPLKGVQFWLHALERSRCRTILVPARSDRGTGILTEAELRQFAEREGITGGVIPTSALKGEGIEQLLDRIRAEVDWNGRPATVTTETFKAIKDHVLALKEGDATLVTAQQLRDAVSEAAGTDFALQDVATAARHLANHGYVRELRGSRGDEWILLAPQLLHNLAASIVLEARRNPKGLGALDERRLLAGAYRFPELDGLAEREREILLDAAAALFIEHNVCFREALGNEVFLVFPSLINQNRPLIDEQPTIDGNAYTVSGATENVYAALVVLLGYTNTFTRTNQWRNNARYEMAGGHVCGFRMTDEREGEIDLLLYFGESAPPHARQLFQGLFETFLAARPVTVESFPPLFCPTCGYAQPRTEVMKRRREGQEQMFCANCGTRVPFGAAPPSMSRNAAVERNRRVAADRTQYASALTRLKSYVRDAGTATPSCFLSYARGVDAHERWVEILARDLQEADIAVLFDRWHNPPGENIARFAERLDDSDFVAVVGTPALRAKYDSADHAVARELELVNARLGKGVIPILLDGEASASFPPLFKGTVHLDFREEPRYFEQLFDLLLMLYGIPFDTKAVRDLRDALRVPDCASAG